jgi:hypothetical protein
MPATPSMYDQIVSATITALVTAVVGSLIFGPIVQIIARRSQDRKEASTIRQQLIAEVTQVAGAASLALALFRRVGEECRDADKALSRRRLLFRRERLEEQHLAARVHGWVIERRLQVHFGEESKPVVAWHRTLDALNLQFLRLTQQLSPSTPDVQAMLNHTDLSFEKVADFEAVSMTYERSLEDTAQRILCSHMLNPHNKHGLSLHNRPKLTRLSRTRHIQTTVPSTTH